ncbi:arginase family protein [Microbacterium sp. SORGH_AS_0888]|uniref:arginase family protein n=1 Tax=Microbacterium sp. SORGH_AS_0888 TaxID=3041791 RepID=UPI0027837B18|nr:arginase family protein [Microbacterium sp. SORGH_AS_0888]MDQ1127971.1 arginase [Microbacterium sp. SORGH_AS_0888]
MTRFVVVPQWQGSASSRAMQLIDGAEAIAGDLPRSACSRVEVPLEAGDALGTTVWRASALLQVRRALDAALAGIDEPALVVGGDASVSVGAVGHAASRALRLAVVWASARPTLHSPLLASATAFADVALRAIVGEAPDGLRLRPGTIVPADIVLVGARAADEDELGYIEGYGIRSVPVEALADPDAIAAAVRATTADAVYVHVDVDVLDPSEMPGVTSAVPFGVHLPDLLAALARLRAEVPLAGASLTEFAPASAAAAADDLGILLRLVGALA